MLRRILPVIQEEFIENNLSITTSRQTSNLIKRNTTLAGTPVNDVNYTDTFKVSLLKIVLMVNGAKSPLLIA